tara:strand:+ start:1038 stop:1529 length:492 start_codon:yes stop_codon:yes gene_type:complete
MTILLKNKDKLFINGFFFKCSIGKRGLTQNKIEGDKKTPKGTFSLGPLFYRSDRNKKPETKLKTIKIKPNMGWCDDTNSNKYNRLIKINKAIKHEKMYRKDHKYDFLIPISYNYKNPKKNKGSAIFIHLTKNYNKTLGCICISKKDFMILIKVINKNTKIKIN